MSEDKVNQLYRRCVDNTATYMLRNALIVGLGSVLLLRSPRARLASTIFAAGVGLGTGYTECRFKFEYPDDTPTLGMLSSAIRLPPSLSKYNPFQKPTTPSSDAGADASKE